MDGNKRASITEEAARARGAKFRKSARDWIISAAAVLLAAAAVRSCLFTLMRVDGDSMSGTLHNGERMLVSLADVALNGVDRGDVVICRYPNRGWDSFVKRVVAVPGDAVYREYGVTHVVYAERTERGVEIHDAALDPAYVLTGFNAADDYGPRLLGSGEYFVVGDNRYGSHDSRDWLDGDPSGDVGPIAEAMIVGRVRQVVWPLSHFRTVN